MSSPPHAALDSKRRALEELRSADLILLGVGTGSAGVPLSGMIGRWSLLDWFTGDSVSNEIAAAQTHVDGAVLEAQAHLRRALSLVNGEGWTNGVANDGNQLLLHTAVGLRRATREFFDRILANDPQLQAQIAPLGEW
ncbi:MAG: hypothetical protein IPK74_06195 [Deltaproteobacteria bacterium]|nr:hypothetical protein [Deltaproteobacteria bacterium]